MTGHLDVRPPLPLGVYRRPARTALPYPLDEPGCGLFSRARKGLFRAMAASELPPGAGVLVPAYHHGSEVEALRRAGLSVLFYRLDPALEPDEEDLARLAGPDVRALHLIHYLGFPADAARWRRWCDERGLLLIEDAAQAWLAARDGRPVGSIGDVAIYCFYKSVGVPDGAGVISRAGPVSSPRPARAGLSGVARRHAAWLAERSGAMAALRRAVEGRRSYSPAEDFALGPVDDPPSRLTLRLLPRLAGASVAERRRANYARLLEDLGDRVPPAFDRLTDGASPFLFPIRTDDKPGTLRRLREKGVEGLDLWAVPHPSLPQDEFPDAAGLRASVVGLPVHQELRPADLHRIAEAATASR